MPSRRTAEEHADVALDRAKTALAAIEVELHDIDVQIKALDTDEDAARSNARWLKLSGQVAAVLARVAAARAGL